MVFVALSDSFQELTFVRNGLLDDLIREHSCRCLILLPSERAARRLGPRFDRSPVEILVYQGRPPASGEGALHRLLQLKHERGAGPYRRARQESARAREKLFSRIRSGILRAFASVVPERAILCPEPAVLRSLP